MDRRSLITSVAAGAGLCTLQKLADPDPALARTRRRPVTFWDGPVTGGGLSGFQIYLANTGNGFRGQMVQLGSLPTGIQGWRVRGKLNKRGDLRLNFYSLTDLLFLTVLATTVLRRNKMGGFEGSVDLGAGLITLILFQILLDRAATLALAGIYLVELEDRHTNQVGARSLLNARPDCTFSLEHIWVDRNAYDVEPPAIIKGRWGARQDGGVYSTTILPHLDYGPYPDDCSPFEAQNLFVPPGQPKFPDTFDALCGYFFCFLLAYRARERELA
jgi:hypothetical protein